jgi:hypothetical protein
MQLPEYLSKGEYARLIPVVADSGKEQRAVSILLAAMRSVPQFRQSMLATLGIPSGSRTRLHAWTEVCFKDPKTQQAKNDRPDGLLVLDTGKKQWRALVEGKIGKNNLNEEQIKTYLLQAKDYGIDAVLTLSNQFVALPSHHPVKVAKNFAKGVELFHWSWMYVVTQATLLLEDASFHADEQRFILEEVLRYLSHDSSGITRFTQMNKEWKDVIGKVQAGATLLPSDEDVQNTVSSWHQEQRDLCLVMTRKLARPVSLKLSKTHRLDPVQRLTDDCMVLTTEGVLKCTLDIPDIASELDVCASLTRRTIKSSIRVGAPQDKKSTSARVNWLTRQLSKTTPEGVYVKAIRPGKVVDVQATLAEVIQNPDVLEAPGTSIPPSAFEVFYLVDLATKFAGNKIFIEELERVVPHFYEQVAQRIRPWVAPPPVIRHGDPVESDRRPKPAPTDQAEAVAPAGEAQQEVVTSGVGGGIDVEAPHESLLWSSKSGHDSKRPWPVWPCFQNHSVTCIPVWNVAEPGCNA